jgi:hypothetical protein
MQRGGRLFGVSDNSNTKANPPSKYLAFHMLKHYLFIFYSLVTLLSKVERFEIKPLISQKYVEIEVDDNTQVYKYS